MDKHRTVPNHHWHDPVDAHQRADTSILNLLTQSTDREGLSS